MCRRNILATSADGGRAESAAASFTGPSRRSSRASIISVGSCPAVVGVCAGAAASTSAARVAAAAVSILASAAIANSRTGSGRSAAQSDSIVALDSGVPSVASARIACRCGSPPARSPAARFCNAGIIERSRQAAASLIARIWRPRSGPSSNGRSVSRPPAGLMPRSTAACRRPSAIADRWPSESFLGSRNSAKSQPSSSGPPRCSSMPTASPTRFAGSRPLSRSVTSGRADPDAPPAVTAGTRRESVCIVSRNT